MRIIDAHVHLYPPEINRAPAAWAGVQGELHWSTLCTRVRKNGRPVQGFPGMDELLREMDAAGIERAVLVVTALTLLRMLVCPAVVANPL